jgi:glycerol-3-phosphate acyltransferase PlsY
VLARWVIATLVGYLCGSIPVADVAARRHGVELRAVGDRNPGYWNVKAQLGARRALPVLLGDTAKGFAAGLVGVLLVADGVWGIAYAAVAGAMVGHGWPLFARFRGGKSLLAFAGGMLAVAPVPALLAVGLCTLAAGAFRDFGLGVKVGVFGFPLIQLGFDAKERVAATGLLMTIMAVRFVIGAAEAAKVRAWER